jgi:general secretion pathway protein G
MKRLTLGIAIVFAGSMTMYFYCHQRTTARILENQLKNTLWVLRAALDEYTFDKKVVPRTLKDLLQEHYLSEIPIDPITGSNSTWRIVPYKQKFYELTPSDGKAIGHERGNSASVLTQSEVWGVDVRSGSTKTGLDGRRYSEW